MKKTSLTTLVLSFVLLLASCANNSDSNQKSDSAATEVEVKNDTGATPPNPMESTAAKARFEITKSGDVADSKSIINIIVNDQKTMIKEISGEAEHYSTSEFAKYQIPKNATDACGAWWAGQGIYFYAVSTEKGVDIYEGWQAEEVSPEEGYHWKKTKSL